MTKKVTLRQVRANDPKKHLIQLWKFCQRLPKTPTNGFYWPDELINAPNLVEFQKGLLQLRHKEEFDLELLKKQGYVPQYYWWAYNEENHVIGVAKIRPILTPIMWHNGGNVGDRKSVV